MEIQPNSFSFLDTTDLAAGTHYYDSASGQKIGGRTDLSLTGWFDDADGTITLTVEGTNDDSTGWVQVYMTDLKNNTTVNSLTVTNSSLSFAVKLVDFPFRRYRVKVVNTGATNAIIVKGVAV